MGGYCKLKEEAPECTPQRPCFTRGYRPLAMQTTECINKACSSSSLLLDGYKKCRPQGMTPTTHLQLVPRLRMSGAIPLIPLHTFTVCKGTAHVEHTWLGRALSHACKNTCERLANPRINNCLLVQWIKQVDRYDRQGGNTHGI